MQVEKERVLLPAAGVQYGAGLGYGMGVGIGMPVMPMMAMPMMMAPMMPMMGVGMGMCTCEACLRNVCPALIWYLVIETKQGRDATSVFCVGGLRFFLFHQDSIEYRSRLDLVNVVHCWSL